MNAATATVLPSTGAGTRPHLPAVLPVSFLNAGLRGVSSLFGGIADIGTATFRLRPEPAGLPGALLIVMAAACAHRTVAKPRGLSA